MRMHLLRCLRCLPADLQGCRSANHVRRGHHKQVYEPCATVTTSLNGLGDLLLELMGSSLVSESQPAVKASFLDDVALDTSD
jgi:hypothetical protein